VIFSITAVSLATTMSLTSPNF